MTCQQPVYNDKVLKLGRWVYMIEKTRLAMGFLFFALCGKYTKRYFYAVFSENWFWQRQGKKSGMVA